METGYEWYKKVCESYKNKISIPKDVSQEILFIKGAGSELLEKDKKESKKCYTFRHDEHFGFSECMVNMLMQMAYEYGKKEIEQKSFETGYNTARNEMTSNILKVLDVVECNNCNN